MGKQLGRGLAAIFNDVQPYVGADSESEIVAIEIPVYSVTTNPSQPRKFFNEAKMQELIESIKMEGVLQPILVRKFSGELDGESGEEAASQDPSSTDVLTTVKYQIIAGERRWRAAMANNMSTIPAVIIECNDQTALQLGLIENLQRDNLSALEEANSIKSLINDFGKTQEEIAEMLCKSRSYIANTLRLLKLPQSVQDMLQNRQISAGHARAILESPEPEEVARRIVNEKLSVRSTEIIVRKQKTPQKNSGGQRHGNARADSQEPDFLEGRATLEHKSRWPVDGQKNNEMEAGSIAQVPHDYGFAKVEDIASEADYDILLLEKTLADFVGAPVKVTRNKQGCVVKIVFVDLRGLDALLMKCT
ncbi:MAG: ParB/RepB/Spo0J family partition protein [Holosporales bacterium]|jgi:ParB family chromosome partitioning protein|nr:ParB/RepB/Spo0J family partition protein [Holosporales bacterium]